MDLKVFITIPDFSLHGGIRVIVEWTNHLTKWHDVHLHSLNPMSKPDYYHLNKKVKLVGPDMTDMDCLIITSPHSIHFQDHPEAPKKVFLFMQMVEHLFNPRADWVKKCQAFYTSKHPIISISNWNIQSLQGDFKRTGPIHYVGNGVNLKDFPISTNEKDGKTVLIEGWEGYNPAKDTGKIGPTVAQRLRREGYKILAYSQFPIKTLRHVPHEFVYCPDLKTINQLYDSATILIKASKYDARSCAPMEAMTKGTVTARAIIQGDDDLINEQNCLRVGYSQQHLYSISKRLLTDEDLRKKLAQNCIDYVQEYSWDYWMKQINTILCD